MPSDQFAEVKRLYGEVCDLDEPQRSERLHALGATPALIADVLELLGHDAPRVTRFARPVLHFLADLGTESLQPGDVLGAWKLERQIAHGGMGTVFLAQRCDGHFEQTVAIKLLRGIASADALAYLSQERQILARLTHPNIARLLDGGSTPRGQPYLVMEYIEGSAIDEYCCARQLRLSELLQLFHTVCAAVGAAHQRLIVHCDLKPSNILVTADGRPLLLDFGIAQLVGAAVVEGDADAGNRAYTPRYASPEQRNGRALSTATDIYSLGMLLTELLLDQGDVEIDTAELSPERIADAELRAIALKATRADTGQRYASVDALAQDLQRYQRHEPVQARGAASAYRLRKLVQRRWPWVAVGLMFVALTTVFVQRVLSERDRAQSAEAAAIAERDRARQADASSRRVSEFLVSVFDGSDPDAGTGNVPAATLVQQAVARIDELGDEPMVQSTMYVTLARIQHLVGQPEQSQQSFRKAIAIERRLDRPLQLSSHLHDLAALELSALTSAEAERNERAALALREQYAQDQPLLIAESLGALGQILLTLNKRQEAMTLLERRLEILQRIDPRGVDVANALSDLARGDLEMGANERAIERFQRSLELLDKSENGRDERSYSNTQHALAVALGSARRFEEAEALLRELLDVARKQPDGDSGELAWQLAELGRLLVNAGKAPQALPLYAEALEIAARKIGADSLSFAVLSNNAAAAFERSGDWAAAEAAYRRALAIMERAWPETDMTLAHIRQNFGYLLLRIGKLDEAGRRLRAAERALDSTENTLDLGRVHVELAEWHLASGRPDAAAAQLDAIAAALAELPPQIRALALRVRALIIAGKGDSAGAQRMLVEAEDLFRSERGDGDMRSWLFRVDRARLLIGSADGAQQRDGEALLADILLHIEPLLAPDAPLLAQLRAMRSGQ